MTTPGGEPTSFRLVRPTSPGALRVLAEIARHQDELTASITEAVREQLPTFAAMSSPDGFRGDVAGSTGVFHRIAAGDVGSAEGRRYLAKVGERHAREGLPLEDSLRAWQVAARVIIGYAQSAADVLGVSAADTVEVVDTLLVTIESAQQVIAGAHRETERELERSSAEHRSTFVRSLLNNRSQITARAQASANGLDPSREYVAVRIACADEARLDQIAATITRGAEQRGAAGACTLINGHLGVILATAPADLDDAVTGVGPPRRVERLHESFAMATRALHAAQALGLTGTHTFESLALEAAVVADASVGAVLVRRYIERLGDKAIAREILDTLEAYLISGLNVEQTADRIIVHQNTVRYRLAKFEELTGVRLRDPKTQFEIWWALRANAIATHSPA